MHLAGIHFYPQLSSWDSMNLKIHITFSIAPLKIKNISFDIYCYSCKVYISEKEHKFNHGIDKKNNNKWSWKKIMEQFLEQSKFKERKGARSRSFIYENCIIRTLTFCFLKMYLQFFKPSMHILLHKNVLFLLTITLRHALFPSNHSYFPKYLFLRKM